jgi:hypothetical protein
MKSAPANGCHPEMADRMKIRQYVQSGQRKTVQQVLQRFKNVRENLITGNFGQMVAHGHHWKVAGYEVDPNDDALAKKEKSDQLPVTRRIGESLIRACRDSASVIEPNPRWWGCNANMTYLKPVKNGRCAGCQEELTRDMQAGLRLSKDVLCKGCGCWLFGLGE